MRNALFFVALLVTLVSGLIAGYAAGHAIGSEGYLRTRQLADEYAAERDSALERLRAGAAVPAAPAPCASRTLCAGS